MTKTRLIIVATAVLFLGVYAYNRSGSSDQAAFDRLLKKELGEKSESQPRYTASKSDQPKSRQQGSATKTTDTAFEAMVAEEEDEVILDEARQKEIWDLEHFTFELEWKFGKLVKQALQENDRAKLVKRFLPGATGSVPPQSASQSKDGRWWNEETRAVKTRAVKTRAVKTQAVKTQAVKTQAVKTRDGSSSMEEPNKAIADADAMAGFLLRLTEPFTSIDGTSLRVLDILPTDATELAEAAENETVAADNPMKHFKLKVLLTAKGRSDKGPMSMKSTHSLSVRFRNDEDIILGKIVTRWDVQSITHRGTTKSLFSEVTNEYKLDSLELNDNWKCAPGETPNTYSSQVAVADFDLDGFLDIAISTLQGEQYLLRNVDGESFEDVTESRGIPQVRRGSLKTVATWIDYDNDSYPDLLLGDSFYHNNSGERFVEATALSKLRLRAATMGAVVVDFDCDGWLDLYVLNHMGGRNGKKIGFVEDDTQSGVENVLWRNTGRGTFETVTASAGVSGDKRHSFAASWFHANDDHHPDLYLVNDFGRNCFFINQGDGTFKDITETADVGDFANSMGVATGDLDNDGDAEIYVANMFSKMGRRIISHVKPDDYPPGVYRGIEGACAGSHLYTRGTGTDLYDDISVDKDVNAVGWAYAPVFADFDSDGLLDIYATSGFISTDRRKPDG